MTSDTPLITTVIPTYRRPQMLKRAIRSVLNQTHPDFRVAVFDNASGDETADIVAKFMQEDPRVTYHCHPENVGMVNNFNYALRQVRTPYFSILCDDDLLLPAFYETALAGFDRYPDAMFSACSNITMSDKGGAFLGALMPHEGYYAPPEGLLAWRVSSHPAITVNLFRRETIERFGVMNDLMTGDTDLGLRIVAQAPYVISYKRCAIIINHDASASVPAAPEAWWRCCDAMIHNLDQLPGVPPDVLERVKQNLYDDYAQQAYTLGLSSVVRRNFTHTQNAIDVLRKYYHREQQATRLERLLKIQKSIGPARLCVYAAYRLRKAFNYQVKFRRLDMQYRQYVQSTEG